MPAIVAIESDATTFLRIRRPGGATLALTRAEVNQWRTNHPNATLADFEDALNALIDSRWPRAGRAVDIYLHAVAGNPPTLEVQIVNSGDAATPLLWTG